MPVTQRGTRNWLLAGSLAFFVAAPGVIAGCVPYVLTRWQYRTPVLHLPGERILGALLLTGAVAVLVDSFIRFVFEGHGTPAPVVPPEHLVISGLYRHVRNPMYVAILAAITGQALIFGSVRLFAYAGVVWTMFHMFVVLYEEPKLRRTFGRSYIAYLANVRRWRPRLKPWSP
jgi:protein-S-isoprenylcysteine O-methyltransferase Ste14